jgi:hypothetical protein
MTKPCITVDGKQLGDPQKAAEVMVDLIRGEGTAAGKPFPEILGLGSDCFDVVKRESEAALARLDKWEEATKSTDFV